MLRGAPPHLSGMRRVVRNFLTGLAREHVSFRINPEWRSIPRGATVLSFGMGRLGLQKVRDDTPLIAAIGFPHPSEIPDLCQRYDVRHYLQHSAWALEWVKSAGIYPERIFALWPAGIDTDAWAPRQAAKDIDILIYRKIHWDRERWSETLVQPILQTLAQRGLSVRTIDYGHYTPEQYKDLLARALALVFLSPHESQGFACLEALSSGVPVFAWDPGYWMDPERFRYGTPRVQATSVPFFDERCGDVFTDAAAFREKFDAFYDACMRGSFRPRDYVLENLTIAASTGRLLDFYRSV